MLFSVSAVLWIVQVEASREAHGQALQELSVKLQQEYEEKLQQEQRKHREEIENLQVCILHSSSRVHTSSHSQSDFQPRMQMLFEILLFAFSSAIRFSQDVLHSPVIAHILSFRNTHPVAQWAQYIESKNKK